MLADNFKMAEKEYTLGNTGLGDWEKVELDSF